MSESKEKQPAHMVLLEKIEELCEGLKPYSSESQREVINPDEENRKVCLLASVLVEMVIPKDALPEVISKIQELADQPGLKSTKTMVHLQGFVRALSKDVVST